MLTERNSVRDKQKKLFLSGISSSCDVINQTGDRDKVFIGSEFNEINTSAKNFRDLGSTVKKAVPEMFWHFKPWAAYSAHTRKRCLCWNTDGSAVQLTFLRKGLVFLCACMCACTHVRVYACVRVHWKECRSGRKTEKTQALASSLFATLPPCDSEHVTKTPVHTERGGGTIFNTLSLSLHLSENKGETAGIRWDPLRGGPTPHSLSRKAGFPFSDTPSVQWMLLCRQKMPPGFGSSVQPKEKWLMLISSREGRDSDTHLLVKCWNKVKRFQTEQAGS